MDASKNPIVFGRNQIKVKVKVMAKSKITYLAITSVLIKIET